MCGGGEEQGESWECCLQGEECRCLLFEQTEYTATQLLEETLQGIVGSGECCCWEKSAGALFYFSSFFFLAEWIHSMWQLTNWLARLHRGQWRLTVLCAGRIHKTFQQNEYTANQLVDKTSQGQLRPSAVCRENTRCLSAEWMHNWLTAWQDFTGIAETGACQEMSTDVSV